MAFQRATKKRTKLRVAFAGPAGAGKTLTSLQLATAIGGKVALLDTEGESASKYADKFEFDSMSLVKDYNPKHFIQAIKDAEDGGYTSFVVDSLSHEWVGPGGMLDLVGRERDKFGDGWKKYSPVHDSLVQAVLTSKVNIIATLRSKMAYERSEENGKTKIIKLGMAPVTREGMEYEFDFLFDLSAGGLVTVSKSRAWGHIEDGETFRREQYPELFKRLLAWSSQGIDDPSTATEHDPYVAAVLVAAKDAPTMDGLKVLSAEAKDKGYGDNAAIRAALNARATELKAATANG